MNKALIVFASREGQTEKIATRIAEHLSQSDLAVEQINAADAAATARIDFDAYELLVFGASIHAGGLERELVRFIDAHAEQIETKRRSFFLVSLSAAAKDPVMKAEYLLDASQKMQQQLAVEFPDTEMIAGALAYSRYSRMVKWMMNKIAAKAGEVTDTSRDYEYTDWQQVEQYADRLLNSN